MLKKKKTVSGARYFLKWEPVSIFWDHFNVSFGFPPPKKKSQHSSLLPNVSDFKYKNKETKPETPNVTNLPHILKKKESQKKKKTKQQNPPFELVIISGLQTS